MKHFTWKQMILMALVVVVTGCVAIEQADSQRIDSVKETYIGELDGHLDTDVYKFYDAEEQVLCYITIGKWGYAGGSGISCIDRRE